MLKNLKGIDWRKNDLLKIFLISQNDLPITIGPLFFIRVAKKIVHNAI